MKTRTGVIIHGWNRQSPWPTLMDQAAVQRNGLNTNRTNRNQAVDVYHSKYHVFKAASIARAADQSQCFFSFFHAIAKSSL